MVRFALIAVIAAMAFAAPAGADVGKGAKRAAGSLVLQLDGNACDVNLTGADCSLFQTKILSRTAQRTDPRTQAAIREMGRKQLDALIACIN